ncbi:hypothetical protein PoB_001797800 [Plakobranchus ocellatus]|uniref:Uncharacterized protein n=1 Tax=Plakobranchus ocellatus TaxID=259542 RepID=A0AAV3Z9N7_9GAST|nr:hypothetical protein PoB_001797800 [Plakobranchus ocellatus]
MVIGESHEPLDIFDYFWPGHFCTTAMDSEWIWISFLLTSLPRNSTSLLKREYLRGFSRSPYVRNLSKTFLGLSMWSSKLLPSTLTSSKNARTYSQFRPKRTKLITLEKVAGALHKPKDILTNSKSPLPFEGCSLWSRFFVQHLPVRIVGIQFR